MRTRQRQVEQDQRAVGVARKCRQRFVAVDGRNDIDRAVQRGQRVRECLLDKRMVVDDENLHAVSPRLA